MMGTYTCRWLSGLLLMICGGVALAQTAPQNSREAERKLENVRQELRTIARERRALDAERGQATRQLRTVEESIGRLGRSLSETERALRRENAALAELQSERDTMEQHLAEQKAHLAAMLREAYALGSHAPLKLLLAQDQAAGINRALAYHRYAQRERTRRMEEIAVNLHALQVKEEEIATRRASLETLQQAQRQQQTQLENERRTRAAAVAELDKKYTDGQARERELGQDARSLERLLANLRAAAARAEAERQAARREAAREGGAATTAPSSTRPAVASVPAPRVGGLGWPAAGELLTRFGGRLPDGRTSSGILIGAALGTPVTAVADGMVVFSEWMTGYGLILIVDHGGGYMSLYAHNDTLLRDAGDAVKRGDIVAKIGNSGGHGRPALYFELRQDGKPVDPTAWLRRQ